MTSGPSRTCGIDLGGTSIRVGLFDEHLQLLESRSMPTRVTDGPQAAVQAMAEALRSLRAARPKAPLEGIGIGSPGPINLRTGVLGLLPNLPGWDNFPLRDALAKATALPVYLESDANAAAIAEWKLGVGKATGVDSLAMITLGTGVGSGLILHGRVWHGMFGMGGELGHSVIEPGGLVCGCGTAGCLEMYASAGALLRLAREVAVSAEGTAALQQMFATGKEVVPHAIAALAETGDGAAQRAFERLGHYLGLGIANLISTLDLPMIVVGGGVASAWPLFAPAMFRAVHRHSVVYRLARPAQQESLEEDHTFIVPARLGPAAGLLGAALLPSLMGDKAQRNTTLTSEMYR